MKRLFIYTLVVYTFTFCDNPSSRINQVNKEKGRENYQKKDDVPIIDFEKKEHDFGDIQEGEKVEYTFNFKNSGKSPLIIFNVSATCGCTVPEFSNTPVMPGKEGFIKVTFNSGGRSGAQSKSITVVSNSNDAEDHLNIKANVVKKEENKN